EFHIDFECAVRLLLARLRSGGGEDYRKQEEVFHFDGTLSCPAAVRSCSGNGSPSAQTAPSTKYSFFQIGTVFFRVSMSQRQASKAAARCADATTMATLVSPICNLPRR